MGKTFLKKELEQYKQLELEEEKILKEIAPLQKRLNKAIELKKKLQLNIINKAKELGIKKVSIDGYSLKWRNRTVYNYDDNKLINWVKRNGYSHLVKVKEVLDKNLFKSWFKEQKALGNIQEADGYEEVKINEPYIVRQKRT